MFLTEILLKSFLLISSFREEARASFVIFDSDIAKSSFQTVMRELPAGQSAGREEAGTGNAACFSHIITDLGFAVKWGGAVPSVMQEKKNKGNRMKNFDVFHYINKNGS
jgi:hypothetical protein